MSEKKGEREGEGRGKGKGRGGEGGKRKEKGGGRGCIGCSGVKRTHFQRTKAHLQAPMLDSS